MKFNTRYFTVALATILVSQSWAQQLPLSHQSLLNPYQFNPAYAGLNGTEGFLGLRKQWVGIEGAPLTRSFNISTDIYDNMGLGAGVYTHEIGYTQQFAGRLSYAYGLKINDMQDVRFGVDALVLQNSLAVSQLTSDLVDDPVVLGGTDVTGVAFDATFGVYYRFENLEIGIAAPYLIENKVGMDEPNNVVNYRTKRHVLANIQYRYEIVEDEWAVQPMVALRQEFNTPFVYDAGILGEWRNTVWLAAMYRKQTNIAAGAGANISGKFKIGYFYELPTSKISAYTAGSHELFLGIKFGRSQQEIQAEKDSIIAEVEQTTNELRQHLDTEIEEMNKSIEEVKTQQAIDKEETKKMLDESVKKVEEMQNNMQQSAPVEGEIDPKTGKPIGASGPAGKKIGANEKLQKVESSGASGGSVMSELDAGFYVVIGSYQYNRWAENQAMELTDQGIDALVVHNPSRGYYYLFLEKFGNLDAALSKMEEVRQGDYPEAWVHVYDPTKAKK